MMKFYLAVFAFIVSAFFFFPAGAARAEVENYSFDKAHTQIFFGVNHLGFSTSRGKFLDFDGGFVFDRTSPEKSSVNITIKTSSINMDDEKWDTHMKSADLFNVEKFPEMTFKSTAIQLTGEKTADITGDLTLLGVTKPVTLHVTHNKSDKFPMGDFKYVSGFSATAALKRSDFGMNYGLPMLGDDVNIQIEVEGIRTENVATDTAGANK